jgi:hypothetical protein
MKPTENEIERIHRVVSQIRGRKPFAWLTPELKAEIETEMRKKGGRRKKDRMTEWRTAAWVAMAAGLTLRGRDAVVHGVLADMVAMGEAEQNEKGHYRRGPNLPAMAWDKARRRVVPADEVLEVVEEAI